MAASSVIVMEEARRPGTRSLFSYVQLLRAGREVCEGAGVQQTQPCMG